MANFGMQTVYSGSRSLTQAYYESNRKFLTANTKSKAQENLLSILGGKL